MFTDDEKKTLFDGIQPNKNTDIIPEGNIIKPTKTFSIGRDKFDTNFFVDGYLTPSS